MLKGTVFAQRLADNETLLKMMLQTIYKTANSILCQHSLYEYFKKYLGGYLIIMEPDGNIVQNDDDALMSLQNIGYIHPLEKKKHYQNAVRMAESLLDSDNVRSYNTLNEEAGALKIENGLIFSFSGFEFLELKEVKDAENYKEIFETINIFSLLTSDFFNPENQNRLRPNRYSFEDNKEIKKDIIREEILFSLSQDELIEIATKINTTGLEYNFSMLNEVFVGKILLETGFVDENYMEEVIMNGNKGFSAK